MWVVEIIRGIFAEQVRMFVGGGGGGGGGVGGVLSLFSSSSNAFIFLVFFTMSFVRVLLAFGEGQWSMTKS